MRTAEKRVRERERERAAGELRIDDDS